MFQQPEKQTNTQKTNISTWASYKNMFHATKQVAIVILQWENKIKWSDAP